MPVIECKSCHKSGDSRAFRCCNDCGAPLCDDCANEYSGLCPDCDGGDGMRVFHGLF